MKEIKREYLPLYSFFDRSGITAHLEAMAQKGWLLEKMGAWSWRYRKIEPKPLHFSLTYFPKATPYAPLPAEGQEDFWALCAEAGWTLAAESAQVQVFYHKDENAVPIETDPEVEFRNIDRTMRKSIAATYLLLLILSVVQLGFQVWRLWEDPIAMLSSTSNLSSALGFLPLLLVTASELIRMLLWRRKAKAAVEAGLSVPNLNSAKGLSLFIIVLSAIQLGAIFLGSMQSSRVMILTISLMSVFMVAIIALSNIVRNALKHLRFKAWANKAVSIGMVLVLYLAMMSGITTLIFKRDEIPWLRDPAIVERYEYKGMTWTAYGDELPLTIQDLTETDYDQWSTRLTRESSPLMTHIEAAQRPRMDALEQPDLEYEVVIVKAGFLYDLSRQQFIDWVERWNDETPQEFWDEYRPVDAAFWGAAEAYQLYSAGNPANQFLICWPDRMAELHFDWEWEITPQMAATVTEKLQQVE